MNLVPQLQNVDLLPMAVSNGRHIGNAGIVGFSGSRDHGGIIKDFTGQGEGIAEIGRKTGADAVMRTGSLGAAGLNRVDNASFSDVMLRAIDGVSADQNRAAALSEAAITSPESVDIHDLTIAEVEAAMSLNIARTLLSRLTQAWRDVINTR
jgi:flagellar hook-basal body complex protein FliE